MDVGIIYHAGFLACNELRHKPYLCIDMNETAVFFIDKSARERKNIFMYASLPSS
jgi:hypothetical protein